MKWQKLLLFGSIILVAVFLLTLVFRAPSNDTSSAGQNERPLSELGPANDIVSFKNYPPFVVKQALSLFDRENLPTYDEIMRLAASGQINLVSELWRLRRRCPENLSPDECSERIRAFLANRFQPPDNKRFVSLYDRYLRYERELRATQFDKNLTMAERYEIIKRKRREILGDHDAKLVFGFDEARVDYNERLKPFLQETKNLPADKRIQRFNEMRKEVYGDYYQAMAANEPRFSRYETEKLLRNDQWQKLNNNQQQTEVQQLRTKYFGKEGAERMAKVDQKLATEKKHVETYEKAEQAYLNKNAALPEKEKQAALKKMRLEIMGAEEAEAYERRRQYQQYLKNKQK